jgi:uncharacterized membrane protein YhfC
MILYLTHLLNGVMMIALPIILGIYLSRRYRVGWRLWWIGAGTFVLSQIGHIPFNVALTLLFNRGFLPSPPPEYQLLFNSIVLGLSAGLWEEIFRYGAFRWWAKDARSWSKALMMGNGHGGIEAILLGTLVFINYIVMLAAQGMDLSAYIPANQLPMFEEQVATYWSIPWYTSLLGAMERVSTLTMQISLSVIVLQVFLRRNLVWLLIAIGWHALVDALSVYLASTQSVYLVEAVTWGLALISLGAIFALRSPDPVPVAEVTPPGRAPLLDPAIVDTDIDDTYRLDQTRYQ